MFGVGSLIGPPIAGVSMNVSEVNGFFIAILIPVTIYAIQLIKFRKVKL